MVVLCRLIFAWFYVTAGDGQIHFRVMMHHWIHIIYALYLSTKLFKPKRSDDRKVRFDWFDSNKQILVFFRLCGLSSDIFLPIIFRFSFTNDDEQHPLVSLRPTALLPTIPS